MNDYRETSALRTDLEIERVLLRDMKSRSGTSLGAARRDEGRYRDLRYDYPPDELDERKMQSQLVVRVDDDEERNWQRRNERRVELDDREGQIALERV